MTPKEALNTLDETVIRNLELKTVLSVAIKKQIPKKGYGDIVDMCPVCNNVIAEEWLCPNYCKDCGQALDWSDTEC